MGRIKRKPRKKIDIKKKVDTVAIMNEDHKEIGKNLEIAKTELKRYAKKFKKDYIEGYEYNAFIDDSKKTIVNVDRLLTIIFQRTFESILEHGNEEIRETFNTELEELKMCFSPAIAGINKYSKEYDAPLHGVVKEKKLEAHKISFEKIF